VFLANNPLPIKIHEPTWRDHSRGQLLDIFAATTTIAMIRGPAAEVCMGLQSLQLPALVTLAIIDSAFPNSIPMSSKWNLIVKIKHFQDPLK